MELLEQVSLTNASNKITLRINAEGKYYSFQYELQPNAWVMLKDKVDAKFLSTREAGGFIGCVYGLYATSSGTQVSNSASFKYLRYTGKDLVYK
jgi:xylan 1,4-beta-xylosidase